jgi:hypothetical protein
MPLKIVTPTRSASLSRQIRELGQWLELIDPAGDREDLWCSYLVLVASWASRTEEHCFRLKPQARSVNQISEVL